MQRAFLLPSHQCPSGEMKLAQELRGDHVDLVDEDPTQYLAFSREFVVVIVLKVVVGRTRGDTTPMMYRLACDLSCRRFLEG